MRDQLVALLPRMRRFARALCHDADTADDLVQSACERLLRHCPSLGPAIRLDSLMCRIVQNLWLDRCRQRVARGPHLGIDAALEVHGIDGRSETERQMLLAKVRSAIAELPEEQRLVLALVSIEGLSYREAADQLAVPVGTVMSRLSRARSRLAGLVLGADEPAARAARG
ncbi:MAG TPA: sigma-70 family RNA polymerase sigma factor [Geminicoccaceae bacterium]|nr:sigma-70 family RNA polymerase sigma factor [Geminicoccus sp.]HMU48359.1 sigma-70 family RNA polymerase sigma factor [Geminicoccaceae bacterium]